MNGGESPREGTDPVVALQAALTHLERNFEELNQVVIDQGRELARLRRQLDLLQDSVEQQEWERSRPPSTPPPHFGR